MKKLLFFAAFAFLFSNAINAQDTTSTQTTTNEKSFSFGAKAGVNLASISDIDEGTGESIKGRTSFHVGGLAQYSFNEKLAIQVEVLYSEVGNKYEYSDSYNYDGPLRAGGGNYSYNEEVITKLSYISMPILAKYFIITGLSVEAGPQFSQLISAKQDWEETSSDDFGSETDSGSDDIKDFMNGFDIGGAIGASYELDLGLFFSARYVFGLTEIYDVGSLKNKNNVFQLSAGYKFN